MNQLKTLDTPSYSHACGRSVLTALLTVRQLPVSVFCCCSHRPPQCVSHASVHLCAACTGTRPRARERPDARGARKACARDNPPWRTCPPTRPRAPWFQRAVTGWPWQLAPPLSRSPAPTPPPPLRSLPGFRIHFTLCGHGGRYAGGLEPARRCGPSDQSRWARCWGEQQCSCECGGGA